MKVSKIIWEGTKEEFKVVEALFLDTVSVETIPSGAATGILVSPTITPKEAYRIMLKRRSIEKGQMDIYKTLSGTEKMEFGEYLAKMKRTSVQIRGVHGGLGKRINLTPEIQQAGLPGNTEAVVIFSKVDGKTYIGLKPDFVEVLKELKIV